MTYKDILKIASCPWIDVKGIMKLADCGKNTATEIRMEIEKSILDSGKKIPKSTKKHVPTKLVLEYLNLDENYIIRMSNIA